MLKITESNYKRKEDHFLARRQEALSMFLCTGKDLPAWIVLCQSFVLPSEKLAWQWNIMDHQCRALPSTREFLKMPKYRKLPSLLTMHTSVVCIQVHIQALSISFPSLAASPMSWKRPCLCHHQNPNQLLNQQTVTTAKLV